MAGEIANAQAASILVIAHGYLACNLALSSAAGTIDLIPPIPCPQPQMSFQALAEIFPPEPKFILYGSDCGRSSCSNLAPIRSIQNEFWQNRNANVRTPVINSHLVYRLRLEKKKERSSTSHHLICIKYVY